MPLNGSANTDPFCCAKQLQEKVQSAGDICRNPQDSLDCLVLLPTVVLGFHVLQQGILNINHERFESTSAPVIPARIRNNLHASKSPTDVRQQAPERWQPWRQCKEVPNMTSLAIRMQQWLRRCAKASRCPASSRANPGQRREINGCFQSCNAWSGRILQVALAKPKPATARPVARAFR